MGGFGVTIHRDRSVTDLANKGTPFVADAPDHLKRLALNRFYPNDLIEVADWSLPKGAFRHGGGPG